MQVQSTYVMASSASPVLPKYKSRAAVTLGITQILLGVAAIILHIVLLVEHSILAPVGHGIWGGIMFILAGSFQVASGKTQNKCWIITAMIFCILAAVFSTGIMACCSLELVVVADPPYFEHRMDKNEQITIGILNALLLLVGVTECFFAIISSVYACIPTCCENSQQGTLVPHTVNYAPNPAQPGQTMAVLTPMQGAPAQYPNQQAFGATSNGMQFSGPSLAYTEKPVGLQNP